MIDYNSARLPRKIARSLDCLRVWVRVRADFRRVYGRERAADELRALPMHRAQAASAASYLRKVLKHAPSAGIRAAVVAELRAIVAKGKVAR